MKIDVIVSSTREGRFADHPAQWVMNHLASRPNLQLDLVDLRDHELPFFNRPKSPAFTLREYEDANVERFATRIDSADGFIVLVAEYNHGYSAALKNVMDHTFIEWRRKPIAFVGWGNVGGARAIEQLRNVAVEFDMAPIRPAVHILPAVMGAARATTPDDLNPFASLEPKLDALADELTWWADVLATGRHQTET